MPGLIPTAGDVHLSSKATGVEVALNPVVVLLRVCLHAACSPLSVAFNRFWRKENPCETPNLPPLQWERSRARPRQPGCSLLLAAHPLRAEVPQRRHPREVPGVWRKGVGEVVALEVLRTISVRS